MKKFLVLFLTLSLILSLAACGNSDSSVEDTSAPEKVTQSEAPVENLDLPLEQSGSEVGTDTETSAEGAQATPALEGVTIMEEGVSYDYHTVTQDDITLPTVGSVMVRNYQVVDSTDVFFARDGWKWHIAESVYTFDDDAAWNYGYTFAQCIGDYVKGFTPEGDIPAIEMNGETYEAVDESYVSQNLWIEEGVAEIVVQIAVQLPEGYTDGTVCIYNWEEGAQGIVWTKTEDFLKDDSLFFRLNKQ